MRTLLAICPSVSDATSFYRGMGPLSALKVPGWRMEAAPPAIDWSVLARVDAVFMQRPSADAYLQILGMAKNLRRPVWVDYDDDLTEVPPSNPTYQKYLAERANVATFAAHADVVTVSTAAIAARMTGLGARDVRVVPNAWDDRFFRDFAPARPLEKLVFWRGSATHDEDLDVHLDELARIRRAHPDWRWLFCGSPYWKVRQVIPAPQLVVDAVNRDPVDYLRRLEWVRAGVALVPLKDSAFNRAKSNIAWLEATYAGAATVGPDFPEWGRPGVTTYGGAVSLAEAFELAAERYAVSVAESRAYIQEHLLLSQVNRRRAEVLGGLAP